MSDISNALLSELYETIAYYDLVDLTDDQWKELQTICDKWGDKDSIEGEINMYIQKIGYVHVDNDATGGYYGWEPGPELQKKLDEEAAQKKAIVNLRISKGDFVTWLHDEDDDEARRQFVNEVLETILKTGKFEYDIDKKFVDCGYFPFHLIQKKDEAKLNKLVKGTNEESEEEFEETKGAINGVKYELVLTN